MVHIHNGLLLSHKKEQIWVSPNEKRKLLCINTFIWNLERWYWWTYLGASSGDTDIENRLVTQPGKESVGWIERVVWKCIHYYMWSSKWKFALWGRELKSGALWKPRGVECSERWKGGSRGKGHMCTCAWCMTELMYDRVQHSIMEQWVKSLSHVQLFCDPMDNSLLGSSVHEIFQARVLECVAISFSRGSFQHGDRTWVSHTAGRHFTVWASRGAPREQ